MKWRGQDSQLEQSDLAINLIIATLQWQCTSKYILTDPVDELVGGVGEVVVDDVLHLGNVQAPGGDGGGYEDLKPALGEV